MNAPQALVRASEPRPAPSAWRSAPWATDAAAAVAAHTQQHAAKPLLQALLPHVTAKPQADSVKREELARLFRTAAEGAPTARCTGTPAPAVTAAPAAAEAVRPLAVPAARLPASAAELAAAAARRLHDAQMLALLQEGTLAQKKEAAFVALAHAKLAPVRPSVRT